MTQEDKELLLKDLCARLPYGVAVELDEKFRFNKGTRPLVKELLDLYCVEGMKPYLRPMSSMTEEEKNIYEYNKNSNVEVVRIALFNWLNAHHFDYRGLIDKGLAIAVTEENNPYSD